MKLERIKALMDLMAASDLTELSVSEEGAHLRLLREYNPVTPLVAETAPSAKPVAPAPAPPVAQSGYEAKAPLHGIAHFTPAPDQPAFIEVGTRVSKGQTLVVIEAMKMFHPLTAPADGVVEAILVAGGTEVEAGQVLVRIG